ncbi:MAG: AAA family ATPase [Deltaproteobacteria bacterium]|nr:AAA family ATPase [Deltaproteobacteria bacterium]
MSNPLELLIAATPHLPRWVVERSRSDAGFDAPRQLEASVLVCDLAGFADTTNRLTRKGAAGPEETLELLNRWYEAVLAPVLAARGDIVSFAGDSFTALFEDPDPARRRARAHQAAHGILATDTAGARLGLADGELTLGVVGSSSARHPVVLGPAPRAAARAMQEARVDSLYLHEEGELREITARPPPEERAHTPLPSPPIPPIADSDGSTVNSTAALSGTPKEIVERLRPFLSAPVWEGLLQPRRAGQHRPGVILFARVGLARAEPASFAEVENTLSRAAKLIARVGGHVQKIDAGDKGLVILAFFGIPSASPNALARAAEAGRGLADELGLGVAITSGRVFAGVLGAPLRHEVSAVGEPVNRAARILQATPPGEVYCDGPTAEQLTTVTSVALPPLEAKGFARPIALCRLGGGYSGEFQAYVEERAPLIGRDRELTQILAHCALEDPERRRGPGALILEGELGIGKSRLVREASRRLREEGRRIAFGHFGGYQAFRTLGEVAGSLQVPVSESRADLVDALAESFSVGGDKVVLILEDLHLAREDDLAAWRQLLPPLLSRGGALLATTRPGVSLPNLGERLVLEELERTGALALVKHHAPSLSLGEAEAITHRAGGNPLFLEQLALAAAAGGEAIPATVEDAIRERLERLEPLARRVLDTAAIAPPIFDFSALDLLVAEEGSKAVREALFRLLQLGVLRAGPGRTYRFAHDLERTVVHDTLSFAERRTLHRQALAALEQRGGASSAEAFEHLEALGEREAAGRAALVGARRATFARADQEALRLARIAVERLEDPAELCVAEGLIARGLQFMADWRASIDLAARVEGDAERLGLPTEQARMAVIQAGCYSFLAEYEPAEEALRRAEALEPLAPELVPHVGMVRGWNAWGRGLFLEAREALEEVRALAGPESPLRHSITSALISVLINLGEFGVARGLLPPRSARAHIPTYFFHYHYDHMELCGRRADHQTLRVLVEETEELQRHEPVGSRLIHEAEIPRANLREMEGRWEEAGKARAFAAATNLEIEIPWEALELFIVNLTEALFSGDLAGVRARSQVLEELAEHIEAGDQSARCQLLGAIAELLAGEVRGDLPDLVYRNRRYAERSRRWDLILTVETLAALLEEDLDAQGEALAVICEECQKREDRVGERFVRLLAWRRAQSSGLELEAERRWLAFTDRLDAWDTPRWTFGAQLCELPEGLPGVS